MHMIIRHRWPFRIASTALLFFACQAHAQLTAPQNFDKTEAEYQQLAKEPGAVIFNPPEGWHLADPEALPPQVSVMVVGKGQNAFPPSINLSTEEFGGTLKEYLQVVKDINHSRGTEWKDLGTIRTPAGEASLSQADTVTEWGPVRMLHVILLRDGRIYILTAAATREEFSKFYKTFFESLRSIRVNQDPKNMAGNSKSKKDSSKPA